jgi:dTDP-L-rhamnose 4-epimerase
VRILVTGGAGFIGSHLVDALLEAGHEVRVLDNLEAQVHGKGAKRPAYLSADVELQIGDVRDRDAVRRALDGVEIVSHHAAIVGVGQSMYEAERYVSVNSLGAAVVLDEIAARRDQIRKMLVASSMSIYGEGAYRNASGEIVYPPLRATMDLEARRFELSDESGSPLTPVPTPEQKPLQPTSIYAVTKRDHEEMFLAMGAAYGIPTVALRYFNIYGTRQALSNPYTGVMAIFSSRLLNRRRPMIFEDGHQTRDFIHVSDVVRANLLAMDAEIANGTIYNVGTGKATTVLRVAELLSDLLGLREPPDVVGKYRAGDIRHCCSDISRIRRELGYEPQVDLAEGMAELLEWLRGQAAVDRIDQAAEELAKRGLTR